MRWTILIILVIATASVYADKFEVMQYYGKAGQAKCLINGQAIIPFTQFKGYTPLPGFIQEIAIRTNDEVYYSVKGSYFNTQYKPIAASEVGETVLFVSDEYIFNDKKDYTVLISGVPYELIQLYEDVSTLKYNFSCPGYSHSCNLVDLKIDNCTIDKDYISVDFHGLGTDKFSRVNLTRDLVFALYREAEPQEIDRISLPLTTEYYKTGNDSFLLKIPVDDVKQVVKSVNAQVTGCLEMLHKASASGRCTVKKPYNRTIYVRSEAEYECKPKEEGTQPADTICSQVVIVTPEKPAEPPSRLTKVVDFMRRIVHFAITIPSLAK